MSFDQLSFIDRAQLSFFDHKLAADDGVVCIDGLSEDGRRDGIMHTAKADAIEIDREEVSTLAGLQTSDIASTNDCRSPTRAEIQSFAGRHQLTIRIIR